MSTQSLVSPLSRRRPLFRILPWPALRLGRLLREAMQAYASAVCVPYTIMLQSGRAQEPRDRDY